MTGVCISTSVLLASLRAALENIQRQGNMLATVEGKGLDLQEHENDVRYESSWFLETN